MTSSPKQNMRHRPRVHSYYDIRGFCGIRYLPSKFLVLLRGHTFAVNHHRVAIRGRNRPRTRPYANVRNNTSRAVLI